MLTTHRKQQLLSRLKQDGKLVAKDLSLEMGVSEDTIRRDLRELAQEGLLQRVHGGLFRPRPLWSTSQAEKRYGMKARRRSVGQRRR